MENSAVEWLVEKLKSQGLLIGEIDNLVAVKQAKAIEREQKIKFGNEYSHAVMGGCLLTPTEFYNETFKSE